jgi:hypothetical protein
MLLLVALLAAVCAAFLVANHLNTDDEETGETDESISVLTIDTAGLSEIVWEYEGASEALTLGDDDVWKMTTDAAVTIDQQYPDTMLAVLGDITATRVIESTDMAEYGLTEPACKIKIPGGLITGGAAAAIAEEGGTVEILVGDETGLGDQRYLSVGDSKVYLVDTAFYDAFACHASDLVQQEEEQESAT